MKYFDHKTISLLIYLLLSAFIPAQQLALKKYTVEDGLLQSSVYSIIQDRNGYLWFGTEGGVSRFDGTRFINYTTEDGLAGSLIWCIYEDRKGNLWFGSENGGASKYDGKSFKTFRKKDGLPENTILSIIEDNKGYIWFGTEHGGVSKFDGKSFQNFTINNGLHSNTIRTIFKDSRNNIWFSAGVEGKGICKYDGKKLTYINSRTGLVSDSVICISEADDGGIWFGTANGVSKFDGIHFNNFTSKEGFPKSAILAILQDKKGIIWLGTHEEGLWKYENGILSQYTVNNNLSSNDIRSLFQDNRGDLWIGSNTGGVMRMPVERILSYTAKDGLPANSVYAINGDDQGNIWIGAYGGGLAKLSNNKIKMYNDGLINSYISSIVKRDDKQYLIGTQGGLSIFDGKSFTALTKKHGLADNYIYSILTDRKNNYWIATDEAGITKYKDGKFKYYTTENGLISNQVFSVFQDSKEVIWAGTSGGLSRIYNDKITNFTTKDGLPDNVIFHVHEDLQGNIWLSTQKGASKFDGKTFVNLTTKQGLSNNFVNYVIDDQSYIYIGTNNGINIIDKKSLNDSTGLNLKIYTAKEGLISSECTTGGVYKDKDGVMWFGTIKGVMRFDPKEIPTAIEPQVYLTNLKINDISREIQENINLKYSQNYIRFGFTAIAFAFPEKLLYRYKLNGIDNNWNESREPAASYPYLPPGKYKFEVLARNGDGAWSTNPATISFTINPPFWGTWWFRILLSVLVLTAISILYYLKTRQVKARNIELAKMIRERTKELELEKNKSEELLHNILPASLVEELKSKGFVQPREFRNVSIMFTDFKGFTYIASVLPADKLVHELNDMFKEFDRIIVKYNLEKLKTIGDSYMVGAGLPQESEDHAIRIILAGLEMQNIIKMRNESSAIKWEMRTGIHSGYVIAGVVGTKKFSYDIWGDTVNIASRMESAGAPGEINISAYTYMLVRDHFDCEYRGKVNAKGKGELDMYFVKSLKHKMKVPNSSILKPIEL